MSTEPIKPLLCYCCGASTHGRQWHNRDTGFGLCPQCAEFVGERETAEEMKSCYGLEGYNYNYNVETA